MSTRGNLFLAVFGTTAVTLGACAAPPLVDDGDLAGATASDFPVLTGEFLGQPLPGAEPELFAPGIVTTGLFTRDVTMTPEGDEIFFSVAVGARHDFGAILSTRLEEGGWTEPEVTSFAGSTRYMELEPFVTPDGSRLLYVSNRPHDGGDGEPEDQDIWVVDRTDGGWGEPYNLGPPVSSDAPEFFPSVTHDGTIYFTRENPADRSNAIFRSRLVEGRYEEPERLPEVVNSGVARFNATVAADESYLIVPIYGREDSLGATDYYISFRTAADRWSEPIHLGDKVNSANGLEYSAYVSPDARVLFFMSGRPAAATLGDRFTAESLLQLHGEPGNGYADIYWIDASFIEGLRPPDSGS